MESLLLLLRVLISLAAVLGLLFFLRKKLTGKLGTQRGGELSVLERHALGPKASVVLVQAGDRRYLLGVGENQVSVLDSFEPGLPVAALDEQDADSLPTGELQLLPSGDFADLLHAASADRDLAAASPRRSGRRRAVPVVGDPLAGSVLSLQTWRQLRDAVRQGRGA